MEEPIILPGVVIIVDIEHRVTWGFPMKSGEVCVYG